MAMWDACAQPLALGRSSAQPRHIGRGPCFIDKHEAFRFEIKLSVEPVFPPFQDVGAVLFGRVCGLF